MSSPTAWVVWIRSARSAWHRVGVSWSLTSLFSTNMAISETSTQGRLGDTGLLRDGRPSCNLKNGVKTPTLASSLDSSRKRHCSLHAGSTMQSPSPTATQEPVQWQTVKVIWHKSASPPHTDGLIVFARWRQCAAPLNACFLVPMRVKIPNDISIGSAVFAQLTAECPYTLQQAAPSPLKITSSHGGNPDPHLIHGFLGPREFLIQTACRSVEPFLRDRPSDSYTTLLGR